MNQKEIHFADLSPVKGSEQKGKRPVVVISGNAMNAYSKIGIVCPLTSKLKNLKGCIVLKKNKTNGLKVDSEVLVFQIRTISQKRLVKKIGEITDEQLGQIKEGLNEILKY